MSYPLSLPFLHVILGMTMISARHNTDHVPWSLICSHPSSFSVLPIFQEICKFEVLQRCFLSKMMQCISHIRQCAFAFRKEDCEQIYKQLVLWSIVCPKRKNIVKSEEIYCSMIFSDPIIIYMSVFSRLGSLAYLGATLSQSCREHLPSSVHRFGELSSFSAFLTCYPGNDNDFC